MNDEQNLESALFRYGVIYPLLDKSLQEGEKTAIRKQILSKQYDIPGSSRITICERTLRKYMQWYREGGFQGLINCTRKDKGSVKAIPEDVLKKAFEFKEDVPQRSIREIIEMLELSGYIEQGRVKNSTLSRVMAQNTDSLGISYTGHVKTFRRFQKEHVNDTWQSDVKHSIYIKDPKNPREYIKTYLICFLDDRSRKVCGKIYFAENAENVEDCFRKALITMGIPMCFYTDNAKIYKTRRLQVICAELGSKLKYCRPYSPTSKGKLEKFNSYVDRSFEPEAKKLGIETIEELNQYFEYWLSENYNNKVHGETKMRPNEVHTSEKTNIKNISPEEIRRIFIERQQRIANNAATVSLCGNLYKLEGFLAKKKVELRFDKKDLSEIEVYWNSQRYKNAEPLVIKNNVWDDQEDHNTNTPDPEKPLKTSYLNLLKEKYDKKLMDKANRINYSNLYGGDKNV